VREIRGIKWKGKREEKENTIQEYPEILLIFNTDRTMVTVQRD